MALITFFPPTPPQSKNMDDKFGIGIPAHGYSLCQFHFLLVAKTNHINMLLKNAKTFWLYTSLLVPVNFIKAKKKNAFRKPFLHCNYK